MIFQDGVYAELKWSHQYALKEMGLIFFVFCPPFAT